MWGHYFVQEEDRRVLASQSDFLQSRQHVTFCFVLNTKLVSISFVLLYPIIQLLRCRGTYTEASILMPVDFYVKKSMAFANHIIS